MATGHGVKRASSLQAGIAVPAAREAQGGEGARTAAHHHGLALSGCLLIRADYRLRADALVQAACQNSCHLPESF